VCWTSGYVGTRTSLIGLNFSFFSFFPSSSPFVNCKFPEREDARRRRKSALFYPVILCSDQAPSPTLSLSPCVDDLSKRNAHRRSKHPMDMCLSRSFLFYVLLFSLWVFFAFPLFSSFAILTPPRSGQQQSRVGSPMLSFLETCDIPM